MFSQLLKFVCITAMINLCLPLKQTQQFTKPHKLDLLVVTGEEKSLIECYLKLKVSRHPRF